MGNKNRKTFWVQTIVATTVVISATVGIFLYTSGYRFVKNNKDDSGNSKEINLTQTGMVNVKSNPDGANVYLDGSLKTATNGTISGIKPGKHNLRLIKNGFMVWEKQIEVFSELVTDITAVLVAQSPRLEPLTNSGAAYPVISPSLNKLAFFSKNSSTPGVWVIPLSGDALNLFRSNPYVVLEDVPGRFYSRGKSIRWSPEEDGLLVEGSEGNFYLVDLDSGSARFISNVEDIRKKWDEIIVKDRIDFMENLSVPEELNDIAILPETLWAPDGKKFLYVCSREEVSSDRLEELGMSELPLCETLGIDMAESEGFGDGGSGEALENNNVLEYRVYNMEKPIPVGEKVETVVFTTFASEPQPAISWYEDSFHLILAEKNTQENTGRISLIRIDGTNKIEVYNNTLYSDRVFTSPGGEKLIFLTTFKSEGQTDLYTVGIR